MINEENTNDLIIKIVIDIVLYNAIKAMTLFIDGIGYGVEDAEINFDDEKEGYINFVLDVPEIGGVEKLTFQQAYNYFKLACEQYSEKNPNEEKEITELLVKFKEKYCKE